MKKIYVAALLFAAVSTAFVSCGGSKSESTSADEDTTEMTTDSLTDESTDDFGDATDETEDESSSDETASADVEELLDSYESYVDEYISFMKKAVSGDMTAMAKYPELLQKARDFSEKCEAAKGDFTSAQLNRYMEITAKMTEAAKDMQ